MINLDGILVVEGKDDMVALNRVVKANIFVLHGMTGANNKKIDYLKKLSQNTKIYLLTDPDAAGVKIRNKINSKIENVINLYASRKKATRNNNVGIENMSDSDLIEIFKNIRENKEKNDIKDVFSLKDLIDNNLVSSPDSKLRREILGDKLNISYSNAKTLLKKLNAINITKNDFNKALEYVEKYLDVKEKNACIFGKFYPVHKGHVNFIKNASKYCKNLYVFVCSETTRDEKLFMESSLRKKMSIKDRINCVKEELRGYKNIFVYEINEDGIKPYPNGWFDWAKRVNMYLDKYDIKVDYVFTNEIADIKNYKTYLNLEAKSFDLDRLEFNISATKIRNEFDKYIDFVPESVKRFQKG
ncbi:ribonuclease M5 [Oceanivirga miroungae]|uniref:Ribonuclease M5 n=1 Tax=Oceanivirga miroungae TaxID=1130046 RepID=A0A6I8MC56_9FUSO|nr:ribonuclease M5 [Oceanivirga miroungae]VWL85830.1 nicotinamide-nucleotide adenylyltransferase [Oceanivirga miroungae]